LYVLVWQSGDAAEELPTVIGIKRTKTWIAAADFLKAMSSLPEQYR